MTGRPAHVGTRAGSGGPSVAVAAGDTKTCQFCGGTFQKTRNESRPSFAGKKYCSRTCASKSNGFGHREPPKPHLQDPDWRRRAACTAPWVDRELFFHRDREAGDSAARRDEQAKAICARCPVAADCLATALASREKHGVFGGLTETERSELSKRGAIA